MFNSNDVPSTGSSNIKPGINVNIPIELSFESMKEGNSPVLVLKAADGKFKKVFWEPKTEPLKFERNAKVPVKDFMGTNIAKGESLTPESAYIYDCYMLGQNLKSIIQAVKVEGPFGGTDYSSLAKSVVALFNKAESKNVDLKIVYNSKGYYDLPMFGWIAPANSNSLTINAQYDKLTKAGEPTTDVTSSPTLSEDPPF